MVRGRSNAKFKSDYEYHYDSEVNYCNNEQLLEEFKICRHNFITTYS